MAELEELAAALKSAPDDSTRAPIHAALALYYGRQDQHYKRNSHAQQSIIGIKGLHENGLADYNRALDILATRVSTYGIEVLREAVDELSNYLGVNHPFVYLALGRLCDHMKVAAANQLEERRAIDERRRAFAVAQFGVGSKEAWRHLSSMALLGHQLGETAQALIDLEGVLRGFAACDARDEALSIFEALSKLDLVTSEGSERRQRQREQLLVDTSRSHNIIRKWRIRRNPNIGRQFSQLCAEHAFETVRERLTPDLLAWCQVSLRNRDSEAELKSLASLETCKTWPERGAVLLLESFHKELLRQVDADAVEWAAIEMMEGYQTEAEANLRSDDDEGLLEKSEAAWQSQAFDQLVLHVTHFGSRHP